MSSFLQSLLVLIVCIAGVTSDCEIDASKLEEEWGYVDVRPGAHQFWWYMKSPCGDAEKAPIVLWLQGGPGGSGVAYGNFMEIGPLNQNLTSRQYTWLKDSSLIFIDSPVGAGYSYVDSDAAYATSVYMVANDLARTLDKVSSLIKKKFYGGAALPPLFVFSESYGGKVAPVLGARIVNQKRRGFLRDLNLGGVAIGDGAVSMVDSGVMYADFLLQTSQIDISQHRQLDEIGRFLELEYAVGNYKMAGQLLGLMLQGINNVTDNLFVYNVLYHHMPTPSLQSRQGLQSSAQRQQQTRENLQALIRGYRTFKGAEERALLMDSIGGQLEHPFRQQLEIDYSGVNLAKIMHTTIREKLGVIPAHVKWGSQALNSYLHLQEDIIHDVMDSVDKCIAAGMEVVVYNGMLDLIINSAGQDRWIERLEWPELPQYYDQPRLPLYPPSLAEDKKTGAFVKRYKNFSYYWVLMSGHMVPIDSPEMAAEMMRQITRRGHNNKGVSYF